MEWPSNKIVSVVIVTCGKKDYLKSCLNSLKSQTYSVFEIIVIDNSLNSNFSREINERYPDIKLYSSLKNLFYCEALNKGIKMSKGDFILCLNDDVILDKRFMEEALKGFSIDERIGMVSGKILRSDGKTIDSTGLFLSIWRTAKERGYGLRDIGRYEREEYIFGVNGAVAFYRREMLEDIKVGSDYFDRDYHFFYEDLDIAWRAQNFGWKAYYIPEAIAYHARGATVRKSLGIGKPYARKYLSSDLHSGLIKNRYLTLIKNESYLDFLLHLPFILSYDILVWIYILFFRPNLIPSFFLDLKYLKSAFKKRRLAKKVGLYFKNL
ncbi:MAG: glycosyltransferase family 2 protein [Candidatus Omnitrophota bacterium]|nr:glycosyltransferase family 2 protein [Candidatus Omnitrophota bacterium]